MIGTYYEEVLFEYKLNFRVCVRVFAFVGSILGYTCDSSTNSCCRCLCFLLCLF